MATGLQSKAWGTSARRAHASTRGMCSFVHVGLAQWMGGSVIGGGVGIEADRNFGVSID